jgi:ABC transport system ATP-binding/permease protein
VALISLRDVSLAYGGPPLLERVDLHIEEGERVCLMGRNGTGKSTLLRLVHGDETPDGGELVRAPELRTALLPQMVPSAAAGRVEELVLAGAGGPDNEEAWKHRRQFDMVLEGLRLEREARFAELSGGLKRRVFLARALVTRPDLLLLDEPTNHLDISSIQWLEQFLSRHGGTMLFVTHDRALIGKLATRIVELDRGRLLSYPGSFASFQRRRAEALVAEESQRAEFDRKLAVEETWIRQGIKARRTRNEGRVRALKKLREERGARRERIGNASMKIQGADRSGKLVIVARDIAFAYGTAAPVVDGLTTTVMRGDRVGLVGDNGIGKTTLLRVLLGQLEPTRGSVRQGTGLRVAYLDQLRAQLREDRSVADNVADGADSVMLGGKPRHVISYLKEFLFAPERARSPSSVLSGGERNRLLLARLFAQPSNVLVLDEPTNDLDAETLELLEEQLLQYPGTVLLVSHDRAFLDAVVTSTLVFEGAGAVNEYVGGYEDWLRQRAPVDGPADKAAKPRKKERRSAEPKPRKRTYAENLELAKLPDRIEVLETEQANLDGRLAAPDLYRQGRDAVTAVQDRRAQVESELAGLYERWELLESLPER